MARHTLGPSRASLHGQWSSALEPALVIEPGDVVVFEDTLDVAWGEGQHVPGAPTRPKFPRATGDHPDAERDNGPGLQGPVAIRGAVPGQALQCDLLAIETHDWGWTW